MARPIKNDRKAITVIIINTFFFIVLLISLFKSITFNPSIQIYQHALKHIHYLCV